MGKPAISYAPRSDVTPEAEVSALANVYRFIIDRHANKHARAGHTTGDDARGSKSVRAKDDYTRT